MNSFKAPQQPSMRAAPQPAGDRQAPAIDSKEIVLDAAQRLISQYGYSGFSMRDLANECGLAKATLYHHFEDKRAIFLQVLQRDLKIACNCIAAAAAPPGDFSTRLRNVARAFFALAVERGMLLLSTLRQAAGMEEDFCLLMRSYQDELQRPVVQLFKEAKAEGVTRPIDPELAAMAFFGVLQGLTSRHLLVNDVELGEQTIDFVLDITLHGLLRAPADDRS